MYLCYIPGEMTQYMSVYCAHYLYLQRPERGTGPPVTGVSQFSDIMSMVTGKPGSFERAVSIHNDWAIYQALYINNYKAVWWHDYLSKYLYEIPFVGPCPFHPWTFISMRVHLHLSFQNDQ